MDALSPGESLQLGATVTDNDIVVSFKYIVGENMAITLARSILLVKKVFKWFREEVMSLFLS